MNIITRASVKERIHVEQIIRSQPHMHNSGLVDIVTIPVRKCLGLSMDVYKPVGEVKEPLPIILDVHGGGLIAGRKEQNRNLGIQLARRGYIVFIPDYRLVPETDIFGQISDILDALAVIEAKAAEFGGNIEKLFVTADSAGAFLASMAVASLHHPTEMQPVIRRLERYIPQKVQALRVTAMGFQSGMFYLYKGQFTMIEFNKPYDKAYGFWHVTTEGDCEGRSITDLGVFEGNIDTIALALADRCYYYTLYFTAVDPTAYDKTPKKDEINISIYGASGMYDMTKEERLDAMRNMLKDRPVFVRDGDRADTFIISTKQESREKRRQKVLDKLTAEERELLGV